MTDKRETEPAENFENFKRKWREESGYRKQEEYVAVFIEMLEEIVEEGKKYHG